MMSWKRKLAAKVGRMLDVTVIPNGGLSGWPETLFLNRLLERLTIDCVLDVGANVGQYGLYLRKIGYRGLILSFEPGPEMGAELQQASSGDPLWHVFPYALGREDGVLPFNIMKASVLSSFRTPVEDKGQPFSDENVIDRTIEVPVKTLATTYAELQTRFRFERPMLKMDTQGFDLEVVAGAGKTLQSFLALSSEVAIKQIYRDNPPMAESLACYSEAGFDLIGLYSVHPGNLLDPHEFNCYVLRRDLATL